MATLSDMPVELLLDNLMPIIPVPDLLHLSSTNKYFAQLGEDEIFWKNKLFEDFNFSNSALFAGKASTLKFIYRGLSKPHVFVWGDRSNGRLGTISSQYREVPFPTRLRIDARIVSLAAGGMSFHALDSEGRIHVWGTLDGSSFALQSDGFSESGKTTEIPLILQLPSKTTSISCGRLHTSTLDSQKRIYTFLNWGRPFSLASASLDGSSPDSTPIQVECGWSFSAALTASGDVLVWWPFGDSIQAQVTAKNQEFDDQGNKAVATEGVIPCSLWDMSFDPVRLCSLPELRSEDSDKDDSEDIKLIQIAGFEDHIIGLSNKGHVLKISGMESAERASQAHWEYLPEFSEIARVKNHDVFMTPADHHLVAPETLKITHISAHYLTFVAYSSGTVLMGTTDTSVESKPQILPVLQNKSIVSVVLGDYHNAALTSTGKLYTWGGYSSGALGLGDPAHIDPGTPGGYADNRDRISAAEGRHRTPPVVNTPTEVRFDHGRTKPKERFCFAATAAGWHTGALVIDLEPDESDDEDIQEEEYDEAAREEFARAGVQQAPYSTGPPIFPHRGVHFRVGHAGRGTSVGRGRIRIGFAGRGLPRGGFGQGGGDLV